MSSATKSTDHDEIRRWIEERGGRPARVNASGHNQGGGILRVDFDDPSGEQDVQLERISWEEFFETFEDNELEFLHQDRTQDGKVSRFNKLVRRDGGEG